MPNIHEIARDLLTAYSEIDKARSEISNHIDDEIEESSEFDDHELSVCHKAAYSALRTLERLISNMVRENIDSEQLRLEISKALLVEELKGQKNKTLRRIINGKE